VAGRRLQHREFVGEKALELGLRHVRGTTTRAALPGISLTRLTRRRTMSASHSVAPSFLITCNQLVSRSNWCCSGPPTFAHACQRPRELRLTSHPNVVHRSGEAGPTMPWFELAPARATSLRLLVRPASFGSASRLRLLAPPGKLRLGKPASLAGPPGNFRLGKPAGEGRVPPATRMSPST
jgi:hypothetical protein